MTISLAIVEVQTVMVEMEAMESMAHAQMLQKIAKKQISNPMILILAQVHTNICMKYIVGKRVDFAMRVDRKNLLRVLPRQQQQLLKDVKIPEIVDGLTGLDTEAAPQRISNITANDIAIIAEFTFFIPKIFVAINKNLRVVKYNYRIKYTPIIAS